MEFIEAGLFEYTGFDKFGYVYYPNTCLEKKCKVHVVLHGCFQGHQGVEKTLIEYSGFNEWAVYNDLIVLYPQVAYSFR